MTQILPEQLVEGESNVLWGVPDDVLLLLKQYDFSEHVSPTYTVTGSPNGLHFICVWPTKESKLGDKVLQDIMKIHQITEIKTAEIATQTSDSGCGDSDVVDNTHGPIEYPEYQNHEELDIEIEKTERMESGCFESSSCSKSNSADSGHQPSDDQISDKNEKKELDEIITDIEEIEPIHSIDNITKTEKHKIVRPGFDSYQSSAQPIRNMHNIHHFNPSFPNMPYSGLALIQQQAALRNHQIQMQHNNTNIVPKSEYTHPAVNQVQMGEPNVRQHLNDIYRKYNIVPKRIQGGTLEEVLRPPMKSQGHRTAHQIHLMRRMREVSSKMNLTDCANPNYEDAVSVLLDSFEITAPYVNAPEYRRKMNFLLRKRINNRRWFLRKKAKGASMSESPMTMDESSPKLDSPTSASAPSAQPSHLREYFNPLMAAALASTRPAGPLIGGTPMIDTKVDLTVN